MALPSHIGNVLHRLGCILSICLSMLAVLGSPPVVSAAHAETAPGVTMIVAAQVQHTTTCHSAPVCAAFVAPAETSIDKLSQVRTLQFVIFDSMKLVQFGPSSDTLPPRV